MQYQSTNSENIQVVYEYEASYLQDNNHSNIIIKDINEEKCI